LAQRHVVGILDIGNELGVLGGCRPREIGGDGVGCRLEPGEPLVYSRRRMDWLMQPMK